MLMMRASRGGAGSDGRGEGGLTEEVWETNRLTCHRRTSAPPYWQPCSPLSVSDGKTGSQAKKKIHLRGKRIQRGGGKGHASSKRDVQVNCLLLISRKRPQNSIKEREGRKRSTGKGEKGSRCTSRPERGFPSGDNFLSLTVQSTLLTEKDRWIGRSKRRTSIAEGKAGSKRIDKEALFGVERPYDGSGKDGEEKPDREDPE